MRAGETDPFSWCREGWAVGRMIAVETTSLGRIYKGQHRRPEVVALDGVSMTIEEGEIRGLLGPNGAGKTTLVKILSTVLLPTHGSASVLGHDVVRDARAVRPLIGIVFGGERGLYWNLTGRQNLEYWAALYDVAAKDTHARIAALLERVGLAERAEDLVETYSRGMKQRLHLARGLIANPKVLFLDEPTSGMDPLATRDFRRLVKELQFEGRTILLTTHDMAEAEAICDRVAFIDRGRVVAMETPRTLSRWMTKGERIDFDCQRPDIADSVRALPGVVSVSLLLPGSYRVEVADEQSAQAALRLLVGNGVTVLCASRPNLEEVYLRIVGERAGDSAPKVTN